MAPFKKDKYNQANLSLSSNDRSRPLSYQWLLFRIYSKQIHSRLLQKIGFSFIGFIKPVKY